jgi:glucose-6-phosphate isomerase
MPLTIQRVSPGLLIDAYGEESTRLRAGEAIHKIWARQPGLWKHDPQHARIISNRLGWIGVLDPMRTESPALRDFARDIDESGVRDIVLLGMGGSSVAPEVFSLVFSQGSARGPAQGRRRFFVLDSTDPAAIQQVDRSIDLAHTLFVVASKSGKTIETLSQFFYFHQRVTQAGLVPAGRSFLAITDRGSYLDSLAGDYSFRMTFRNPADIGGRYSALSYFGLVPAALWGVDIAAVLDSAMEMRKACGPEGDADANPALELASLLGAAARRGDDKLFLLSTPKLTPLGNWIEQLIAESLGKEERGIVPVAGGVSPPVDVLARGGVTAALFLEGDDRTALEATLRALEERGAAFVEIRLQAPEQLGAEFFKWETATALAGASLAIDPFDEPNVQESKDNTARILETFELSGEMPLGSARLVESGIELYADGAVRGSISTLQLSAALRTFFSESRPDDYVAILAYVARDAANGAQLDALRATLGERLGLPVLLGYGPRYMHSIGQLYKGGPTSGMFLMITSEKSSDLAIPGAKYTFGQLEMAQALGDLESLGRLGKPALRLHLTEGAPAGLASLRRAVDQALAASRSAL